MTVASSLQSISDSRSLMISEVRMSSNSCVDCIVQSQLGGHNFLSQDAVSFHSIQFLGICRQFLICVAKGTQIFKFGSKTNSDYSVDRRTSMKVNNK